MIVPVGPRHTDVGRLYAEYRAAVQQLEHPFEFIFVLDGPDHESRAQLAALARSNEPVTVVALSRSFGEATALIVGLSHARGSLILTLPAYNQILPAEIGLLVTALQDCDVAVAVRDRRKGGPFEKLRRWTFHALLAAFTGQHFRDLGCGARALRREVFDQLTVYGDQHRFIPVFAHQQGFRVREVEVRQSPFDRRLGGYGPRVYARRALDLLSVFFLVRFTKKPLRFFGFIGTLIAGTGVAIILVLVLQRLLRPAAAGRPAGPVARVAAGRAGRAARLAGRARRADHLHARPRDQGLPHRGSDPVPRCRRPVADGRLLSRLLPSNVDDVVGMLSRILRTGDPAAWAEVAPHGNGRACRARSISSPATSRRRIYARAPAPELPIIFVCGPARSGTSLMAQVLIRQLPVTYFSNVVGLFPRSPLTATRIMSFALEQRSVSFRSFYGKSRGLSEPNDAMGIWDRWFPGDRNRLPDPPGTAALEAMKRFFGAWQEAWHTPIVAKNNRLYAYGEHVARALPTAHFVCLVRDPVYLAQSQLLARQLLLRPPRPAVRDPDARIRSPGATRASSRGRLRAGRGRSRGRRTDPRGNRTVAILDGVVRTFLRGPKRVARALVARSPCASHSLR